ncbi:MAG: hypothetical protein ACK567_03465 [Chitinophagales bacterium]|jgi:hypothetical protein|nr:hypothetical protein [Sphingobacteriales bacterium]
MELNQFDLNLDRFKFIIENNGLRLIKNRIASNTDTFVEFEDIGSKIIIDKSRKLLWLILSLLFLIIAVWIFINRLEGDKIGAGAEIFHIVISLFFLTIFLLTKKNIIFLTKNDNTNAIEFIGTKRYKKQVDEFIKELHRRRDKYLVDNYSTLNEFLPYNQQYNNLVWLYELKLLTKEELNKKINELDEIQFKTDSQEKNNTNNPIGFKKSNFLDEKNYAENEI